MSQPPDASAATPPTPKPQAQERVGARTFGIVTLAILSSRILGLVREMVLAYYFAGENKKWFDCFLTAFRMPNMLRDLFAEGALSTAFVTTFTKRAQTEGDESAWALASKVMTLAAVAMSIVSILGIIFAKPITMILAPGWIHETPEKVEFTLYLARIMYPFILMVSLAALVMGMLNAKKVFGMPAMASTFFNIFSMIGGGLLGWWMDPHFGKTALIGFAFGTLIGGLAQLCVQFPSLRRVGYRFKLDFDWKDSGVKKVLELMWPAVISGSVVQFNVMLNSVFASYLVMKDGPVTWLNYSFRLIQLPLGLFGVAVATITLPAMSRLATEGISEGFKDTLARGLKLVFLMTLPSAVGMAFLAEPIISLIYERGKFTPEDTMMTALALRTYAWGLVFYSGIKVIQPAFYAIERRFVPLTVSAVAVAVSAILNSICVFGLKLGHDYLALGTSVSAFVNFTLLFLVMSRIGQGMHGRDLAINFSKLLVSVVAMAGVCIAAQHTVLASWHEHRFVFKCAALFGTIGVAAVVYFGMNALLKNEEVAEFKTILRRKLRRS